MKDLKPYLVEFEKGESMKIKNYLDDCVVDGNIHQLIIVITYDQCIFFTNNGI